MTGGDTQVFPETGRTDAFRPDRGPAGDRDLAKNEAPRGGRAVLGAESKIRIPESRRRLSGSGGRLPGPGSRLSEPSGLISDPWDESAPGSGDAFAATGTRTGAGATGAAGDPTHDPHEVTVQLDAAQFGDVQLSQAESAARVGGQEGSDGPVFVDESGRRSRTFRRLGMLVGIACAVYAVVIVATLLSGSSDAPWLPVPGQNDDTPASQVDGSPLPADSAARPSGSGSAPPGTGTVPTAGDGTAPSPDARATESGSGKNSAEPGRSADPEPTATKTTAGPGGGHGSSPSAKPSSQPASTPPAPSSPVEGSADPTESPVSGGGTTGTGSVADGPATPTPVAADPGGPATSPTRLSPEHIL
ncbi:hypothetical protein [Streptomyces sp. NPDC058964]|uniref:hypothetical protein n=1 Tax=Streptomyces sp. NPDC058964 TaxID=3346681 RepID=UPI0036BDC7CF